MTRHDYTDDREHRKERNRFDSFVDKMLRENIDNEMTKSAIADDIDYRLGGLLESVATATMEIAEEKYRKEIDDSHSRGHEQGHESGYEEGYKEGYKDGWHAAWEKWF